jgi:ribonuclease-3
MNYQEALDRKIKEWDIEGINTELLKTALMHPSYDMEGKRNNQRLEFLGDAVLGLIVGEYLFSEYPDWHEGALTRNRALLAKEETLAKVAKNIGLDTVLLLGKGEEKDGGRKRPSTLADAMESVIAAIYLSFGLGRAERFVLTYFGGIEKPQDDQEEVISDYKTELQEYVQKYKAENVTYAILSEEGPPHQRIFTAGVYLFGKQIGEGKGKSKKEAEKIAARIGYHTLLKESRDGEE